MSHVKPRRTRERQGSDTRAAIIGAAAELFEREGYARTTVGAIAERAGVVIQTIYNAIGPKSAVLAAVLDRAASGPEAPRLVPVFLAERTAGVATAQELVEMLADWFAEVAPRLAGMNRVVAEASATDEAVAQLERARASRRFNNYGKAADALLALPGVRVQSREAIAAVLWTVGNAFVHRHLTEVEGWDAAAYREWVGSTLTAALLTD
jgi:AcrR family transcriptional regulator